MTSFTHTTALDAWILGLWTPGPVDSGRLEAWTLDNWTLEIWMVGHFDSTCESLRITLILQRA